MESTTKNNNSTIVTIVAVVIAIIFAFIGAVAGILFLVIGMMKNNGAYESALSYAQNSPQLERTIGSPMTAGRFVSGSISTSGPNGQAALSFNLKGPDGSARISAEAIKRLDEWTTLQLVATLQDDERIVLIENGRPSM